MKVVIVSLFFFFFFLSKKKLSSLTDCTIRVGLCRIPFHFGFLVFAFMFALASVILVLCECVAQFDQFYLAWFDTTGLLVWKRKPVLNVV